MIIFFYVMTFRIDWEEGTSPVMSRQDGDDDDDDDDEDYVPPMYIR